MKRVNEWEEDQNLLNNGTETYQILFFTIKRSTREKDECKKKLSIKVLEAIQRMMKKL